MLFFKKQSAPSTDDQTILSNVSGPPIDRSQAQWFEKEFPRGAVKRTLTKGGALETLSVPRTMLREKILNDTDFRRTLRDSKQLKIQDVYARSGAIGQTMGPREYVKDVKYNKLSKQDAKSLIPFDIRIGWLEDRLGEWGYVRIPAALILLIAGMAIYGACRLGFFAKRVVEEYADAQSAAATSEKGLDRAVQARSGIKIPAPPPATAEVGLTDAKPNVSKQ